MAQPRWKRAWQFCEEGNYKAAAAQLCCEMELSRTGLRAAGAALLTIYANMSPEECSLRHCKFIDNLGFSKFDVETGSRLCEVLNGGGAFRPGDAALCVKLARRYAEQVMQTIHRRGNVSQLRQIFEGVGAVGEPLTSDDEEHCDLDDEEPYEPDLDEEEEERSDLDEEEEDESESESEVPIEVPRRMPTKPMRAAYRPRSPIQSSDQSDDEDEEPAPPPRQRKKRAPAIIDDDEDEDEGEATLVPEREVRRRVLQSQIALLQPLASEAAARAAELDRRLSSLQQQLVEQSSEDEEPPGFMAVVSPEQKGERRSARAGLQKKAAPVRKRSGCACLPRFCERREAQTHILHSRSVIPGFSAGLSPGAWFPFRSSPCFPTTAVLSFGKRGPAARPRSGCWWPLQPPPCHSGRCLGKRSRPFPSATRQRLASTPPWATAAASPCRRRRTSPVTSCPCCVPYPTSLQPWAAAWALATPCDAAAPPLTPCSPRSTPQPCQP